MKITLIAYCLRQITYITGASNYLDIKFSDNVYLLLLLNVHRYMPEVRLWILTIN